MNIFAKNKTLRSYPSMDIFNVSKFGSLVNFQLSVSSTSELESSPISFAAVDRTPLQLSLLSKVSIYNLTGKKEKMSRGVGGRLFEGGDQSRDGYYSRKYGISAKSGNLYRRLYGGSGGWGVGKRGPPP